MFNFKNNKDNNRPNTVTVTPSGTLPIIAGSYVNLTMAGGFWTIDDVGLEYYGNGGSAVITTYSATNASIVTAIVKTNLTNISAETDWKLYAGTLDSDGSFKITSTNSLAGIYRIMPEGMVNLYGMS